MSKQPEALIQDQILAYLMLRKIYCWQNKTQGTYDPKIKAFRKAGKYSPKGVSDILGVLPDGKFLAIEVKTKNGRLTQHQRIFLEGVQKHNGIGFVARGVDDVYKHLKTYFNHKWTYI